MKKLNKNNEGFSLIELIIVIAIMAVLVAVIAPSLSKYLGTSKKSTDDKNIDEVVAQVKNCIADATVQNISGLNGTYTLTGTGSGTGTCAGANANFAALIATALADCDTRQKSGTSTSITITLTGDDTNGYTVAATY